MPRGNPNPSPSTRFTKDTAPRVGTKPGPRKKTVARLAKEKAEETLDDMLGQAHRNIKTALNKRDAKVSMWLVDAVRKSRGTRIGAGVFGPLIDALDSLDDVEVISKKALLLSIQGDMSFEELKCVQEALARHSVLAGVIELRSLREEVEKMIEGDAPAKALGKDHMPEWGKLKDVTPTHPERADAPPAE